MINISKHGELSKEISYQHDEPSVKVEYTNLVIYIMVLFQEIGKNKSSKHMQ